MNGSSGPFNPGQALSQAVTLHRQGQLRAAEKIYARVLKAAPGNFDALNLLGAIRMQQGQFGEARGLFSAAAKANPGIAAVWCNLGQAEYALKRPIEALHYFEKAQALAPDDADILYQHANALLRLDRPRDALAELQMVLARKPQHFEARLNSGLAQAALGFPDRALAEFDAALPLAPQHPVAHYNRGVALIRLGRYTEAVAANDRAIAAAPQHSGAWLNRGKALAQLHRMDEAIKSYGEVLALRKDHADAHFNHALALLTVGDYRRGFSEYEWRWRRTGMPPQKSRGRPLWLGEYPLAGKTILLHAEQGLGDTIQFARYVPLIAARGVNVVLEVQPELKSLLSRLEGAAVVVARGEPPPPFDVHCPLGSLPLALKTELHTVTAPISYLSTDEPHLKKWSARLQHIPPPRVAIAWSGNPAHDNDGNRSLPFGALVPLFSLSQLAGVTPSFISIQRDLRSEDAAQLTAETRLTHIGGELDDFSDTAAVLALCDLVISVDTAPVHLAGALGRPVWVLVPFAPDWRWTLEGETTPWYPTARLFRQSSPGDWDAVIARVAAALSQRSFEAISG
ncbi:MAG TPA: tetratricopeptide repeat-containing glycosyltransferase family protein [Xanthobacteraceae bacterium]|nr:tetratricopeptide repeat-containing glycosyltransferase family protein [Xanthobacteraceae bacterium]